LNQAHVSREDLRKFHFHSGGQCGGQQNAP
jgi:hypothetical protein